jgi:hypothetical protein
VRPSPVRLAAACLLLAAPVLAAAWWEEASIRVGVHEHAFHRVTANAIGCVLRVRLYFNAPAEAYRDATAERNHYRFRARVVFSDERYVDSEPFDNGVGGARVFAFSHDTGPEGCWAERPRSLRKVDVQACRGKGCVPLAFD